MIKFNPLEEVFEVVFAYQNTVTIRVEVDTMSFFELSIAYMFQKDASIEQITYLPTGENISMERLHKLVTEAKMSEEFTLEG